MTVAAQASWALGSRWGCPAINSPCTIDSLTRLSEVTPRGPLAEEKEHRPVMAFPVDHIGRGEAL